MEQNDNRPVAVLQEAVTQPLKVAYLIEHGSEETDAVAEALRQAGCEVYLPGVGSLRDMDALVTTTTINPGRVDVMVDGSPGYLRPIEQHESIAAYAAKIVETVRRVQAKNRPQPRQDGRVDIDAVRAGTHDVTNAPAVFESLCDEVEQLRAERELLREVLKTLDLPRPKEYSDYETRRVVAERRANDVRIGLDGYLNGITPVDLAADWVRRSAEDFPVAYEVEGSES